MPVLLSALSDQATFAVRGARDLLFAVVEHAFGSTLWVDFRALLRAWKDAHDCLVTTSCQCA